MEDNSKDKNNTSENKTETNLETPNLSRASSHYSNPVTATTQTVPQPHHKKDISISNSSSARGSRVYKDNRSTHDSSITREKIRRRISYNKYGDTYSRRPRLDIEGMDEEEAEEEEEEEEGEEEGNEGDQEDYNDDGDAVNEDELPLGLAVFNLSENNPSSNISTLKSKRHSKPRSRQVSFHTQRKSMKPVARDSPEYEDTDLNVDTDTNDLQEMEQTIKDRQDILNEFHPFGLPLWKPALYKKSRSVTRNAKSALHSIPTDALYISFGNIVWFILFGWWLGLTIFSLSLILLVLPFGGYEYSKVLSGLAWYIVWPFSKYVEKINPPIDNTVEYAGDEEPLLGGLPKPKPNSRDLLGKIVFYLLFYTVVAPLMLLVSLLCWLMVFSVPMAKLNYLLVKKLKRNPRCLVFKRLESNTNVECINPLLSIHYAFGFGYYKYTYDGINIMFINLLAVVLFTLFDAYVLRRYDNTHPLASQTIIFIGCLLSTVPLAYFIGMAVSSISAQSSLGLGAVINATFGSIVEIILYCFALTEGKADLVEGSIIGSMLAGLLLMPGFSMIGGALKRKQQRFNAKSAGVTSTLLIMSIIGVFTPTLFYSIYAKFELRCTDCSQSSSTVKGNPWACSSCAYYQPHPSESQFYFDYARPLMYICAVILPLAYVIGLWFTLRTHTKLIYAPPSNPSKTLQNIYHKLLPSHILEQLNFTSAKENHNNGKTENQHQEEIANDDKVQSERLMSLQNQSEPQPHDEPEEGSSSSPSKPAAFEGLETIPLAMHQSIVDAIHYTHNRGHDSLTRNVILSDDEDEEEEAGGHDAPEWSKLKSAVILCTCTVLFAAIAEVMVGAVDVVVEGIHITEKMLGLTIFALVPNVTEFVNAISFAMHGNIPLSMEIGSAYTVQVALLQIPSLVAFSAYYHWAKVEDPFNQTFTLIFPRLDMFSVLFSVFLITYVYIEGKSNYFKGSVLVLTYVVWLSAFVFEPNLAHEGAGSLARSAAENTASNFMRVYI